MQITTIRAFLARRQEIETSGSEEERDCLEGLDVLVALVPTFLETIGEIPLVPGEVTEIVEHKNISEAAASGEEGEDALPF